MKTTRMLEKNQSHMLFGRDLEGDYKPLALRPVLPGCSTLDARRDDVMTPRATATASLSSVKERWHAVLERG